MARTVAAAFACDPAWAFIFGEEYERLAEQFAAALFDARVLSQDVWVSDDLAAVSMWDPPERSESARRGAAEIWARYRAIAGEPAMARLARYNDAVAGAAAAVRERHWYLGVLATHPGRRREGLASAVLAPVLADADRRGLACCLETSTVDNRLFYGRRGFTEASEIALPSGPPTWWLRRAPVSAHGAGG